MNNKPKIYFITGVSGAGKSTMVPLLKKELSKNLFDIHDFDEHGVPVRANAKWRQKKTKEWLQLAYTNIKKNKSTIICGITVPEEVLEASDKRKSVQIKFCFLNHPNKQIEERLKKRFKSKVKIKDLNKVFNITPEEFIKNNLKFATIVRKIAKEHKAYIINTTKDVPNQTSDKIIKWVNQK
jgi:broad-specificity NMP kinase